MDELRLGDIIDDYCIKCRRLTNHAIVSIVDGEAAKVRCRSCYHDHTYLREQIPPSKKDLKKLELSNAALANGDVALPAEGEADPDTEAEAEAETETAPQSAAVEEKKSRGRAKKA
jgi:hypothetical protein